MKCHQQKCEAEATLCYRWPGNELTAICEPCSVMASGVAAAMGIELDFRDVSFLEATEVARVARFELASALRRAAEMVEQGFRIDDVVAATLESLIAAERKARNGTL